MDSKIKAQRINISKFTAYCDAVMNMPEPNINKGYLDAKNKIISELWLKLDNTNDEIVENANANDLLTEYFTTNEFDKSFTIYDKVMIKIQTKLEKFVKPPTQLGPVTLPDNLVLNTEKSKIKIKPIEVPEFSGDYKDWISFKNMFESLIHNSTELNDLQRMHYLKSCLTGEAERLISQYDVTEESYKPAYDLLTGRFHNEVILVDTHIINILSQPNLITETSDGIKELMDITTENLRALKSLNIDTDTWDPILLLLLVQKLDFDSRHLWEQTLKPKTRPTIKEFLDFLSHRFYALGCQQKFKFSIESSSTRIQHRSKNRNFNDLSQRICPICSRENHSIFSCENFRGANQYTRVEMVTNAKLCKRCLRNHNSECTQQEGCRVCNGNHHTFLHLDRYEDGK